MPLYFKIIIFSLVFSLTGCSDELVFKTDKDANKLVAAIYLEVGKPASAVVMQTESITNDSNSVTIKNAFVYLFKNGVNIETETTNNLGQTDFDYIVQPGDSLKVEVIKEGFDKLRGSSSIPETTSILQFDTTSTRANSLGLIVSFVDKAKRSDFYKIKLVGSRYSYKIDPVSGQILDSVLIQESIPMKSVNRIFFSDNNIVTNRQDFELMNDLIFNGQNFNLNVDVDWFLLQKKYNKSEVKELEISLSHISPEYYDFLTTLSLNRPIYGGPFSIASQVTSSFDNGYGIIVASNTSKAIITLR